MKFPLKSPFLAFFNAIQTLFTSLTALKEVEPSTWEVFLPILRLFNPESSKYISFGKYRECLAKHFNPDILDFSCRTPTEFADFVPKVPQRSFLFGLTFLHLPLHEDEKEHKLVFGSEHYKGSFIEQTFIFTLFSETLRVLTQFAAKNGSNGVYLQILLSIWNVALKTKQKIIANLVRCDYLWRTIFSLEPFFKNDQEIFGLCFLLLQEAFSAENVTLDDIYQELDPNCIEEITEDGFFYVYGLSVPFPMRASLVNTMKALEASGFTIGSAFSRFTKKPLYLSYTDHSHQEKLPYGPEIYPYYQQMLPKKSEAEIIQKIDLSIEPMDEKSVKVASIPVVPENGNVYNIVVDGDPTTPPRPESPEEEPQVKSPEKKSSRSPSLVRKSRSRTRSSSRSKSPPIEKSKKRKIKEKKKKKKTKTRASSSSPSRSRSRSPSSSKKRKTSRRRHDYSRSRSRSRSSRKRQRSSFPRYRNQQSQTRWNQSSKPHWNNPRNRSNTLNGRNYRSSRVEQSKTLQVHESLTINGIRHQLVYLNGRPARETDNVSKENYICVNGYCYRSSETNATPTNIRVVNNNGKKIITRNNKQQY